MTEPIATAPWVSFEEFLHLGAPNTLDNTMRSNLGDCPRKFYWFLRGVRERQRKAYFTFGSAWGEAIQYWLQNLPPEGLQPQTTEWASLVRQTLDVALRAWEQEPPETPDDTNSWDNLERGILGYAELYSQGESFKFIAGEQGFRFPLPWDVDLYYAGSLDGFLLWEPYGYMVFESKTSSGKIDDRYVDQWSFSTQVTGYNWALRELLGHDRVWGTLMHMTSKKFPKGIRSTNFEPCFRRALVQRSGAQMDNFAKDVLVDFSRLQRMFTLGHFPQSTNQLTCTGTIGRSACEYRTICLSPEDYKIINPIEQFLDFELRSWEPWNRGGEDANTTKEALPET